MDLVRKLSTHLFQPIDLARARRDWSVVRTLYGFKGEAPLLTPPSNNYKLKKSEAPSFGLSLSPANGSGDNVCRFSTHTCREHCVSFSGNGGYPVVEVARRSRTHLLSSRPDAFYTLLLDELERAYEKHGADLRVRLNTFSDIPWETFDGFEVFERWPLLRFYDYTKWSDERILSAPPNYHLTYSLSELDDDLEAALMALRGINTAVVFDTPRGKPLPSSFMGYDVIDGDETDDRWLDPSPVIVGLRAKGTMRGDTTGFVRAAKPAPTKETA